jgi:chitin disaccharide deacetylase
MKRLTTYVLLSVVAIGFESRGSAEEAIRLIIRGDDFGMTQGSLVAFEKAFNEGVLTCGGLQVPAPWFEAAAEMCRKNPRWCIGVHLTLIAEWRGYRWRPVLPADQVKSLVDEDGYLYQSPEEFFAHQPRLDQIEAEFRAQIELAKKRAVKIAYLDTHYISYTQNSGIEEIFKRLAREYHLPFSGRTNEQRMPSVYLVPVDQKVALATKRIEELKPGLWLWVCHIGIDSPEQNALVHAHPKDIFPSPGAGKHRAAELRTLLSHEVKAAIKKKGVVLTDYAKLRQESKE